MMNKLARSRAYEAWRESEAYAIPMTEEGQEKAQYRWINFDKGFNAGIKEAVEYLMDLHKETQDKHNFYHVAANKILQLKETNK